MADTAVTVFRDYVTDGVPASGKNKPKKSAIRTLLRSYEEAIDSLTLMLGASQGAVKATKSQLDAVAGSFTDGDIGVVFADTDLLNGIYVKTGAVWVFERGLPGSAASAAEAAAVAAQALAEAAQAAAEDARDLAAAYASDAVSQGNVPDYGTVLGLSGLTIPVGITSIRLKGYSAAGDGGAWPVAKEIADTGTLLAGQVRSNSSTRRWELVTDVATPEMFGCVANDDGVENSGNLMKWRDYSLRTGAVPRMLPGRIYNVVASTSIGNAGIFEIDAGAGSGFRGPVVFNPNIRAKGSELKVNIVGTDTYTFIFSPAYQADITNRRVWLDAEPGLDYSAYRSVNCTTEPEHFTVAYPGTNPTYTAASASSVTADGFVRALANDGLMRLSLLPAEPASELSAFFGDNGSFYQIAHVRTSKGYVQFRAQDVQAFTVEEALIGAGAITSTGADWVGRPYNTPYSPEKAMWTLRNYDGRTVGLLLNGRELARKTVTGFITHMGFGGLLAGALNIAIQNWTLRRNISIPNSLRALKIVCAGDSYTAPIAGDWPTVMRQILEGSLSASAVVVNLAVNGANSDGVLTQLSGYNLTGTTDVVIMVGANDQQGGVSGGTFRTKLEASFALAVAAGARIHVVLQKPFYDKTLAPGATTTNMLLAGSYRALLQRIAADNGCNVIDLMQELKPALFEMVTDGSLDPGLMDNIHPSTFEKMLIAKVITRRILATAGAKITKLMSPRDLPTRSYLSSPAWTAHATAGSAEMTQDGIARLSGKIVPGSTKTSGTVIMNLPPPIRPVKPQAITARSELASVLLDIATTGDVTLRTNMTGMADTWVSLDGISFATAASA